MSDALLCVLGCRSTENVAYRAVPGTFACNRCASWLYDLLTELVAAYGLLSEVDELIPHGDDSAARVQRSSGPRSPAVDAMLVHTDPRSAGNDQPAALASTAAVLLPGKTWSPTPTGRYEAEVEGTYFGAPLKSWGLWVEFEFEDLHGNRWRRFGDESPRPT